MGKFKIMKQMKPNFLNRKNIFGFDVETYQVDKGSHIEQYFLMGSVVGKNLQEVFWDKKEMGDFLLRDDRLKNSYIMATNLEFDFQHIYTKTKHLKNCFPIDNNGLMYVKFNNKKDRDKREFIDSMNYIKASVEKLGSMLKIPKLPYPSCFKRKPENQIEIKDMEKYNIADSYITFSFGEFIKKFFNSMGCRMKMTIASSGLDNWRRNYQPIDIFQERRSWIEKHFEGSMHGGRTEMFKRGLFSKLWYYDYNSHYPACCKYGVDGKGSYPNPSSARYIKNASKEYIETYEGISKVKINIPFMYIGVLGINYKDKYVFPNGYIEGWFTHIELRQALKEGCEILNISETIYYTDLFIPFFHCVNDLYELRQRYKKECNEPMQLMVKTLMNSALFGKFAQKINNKTNIYSVENMFSTSDGKVYIEKDDKHIVINNFNIRGDYIFEKIEIPNRIPIFIHPILASYTTSMARIKLFNAMNQYKKYMVYCDTDSMVLTKPVFESSNTLGDLKLEHIIKEAIFLKPKFYYLKTKEDKEILRAKGIGRFMKNRERFYDILNGKPSRDKRFTKIKESEVRKLPFSSIIQVNKHIGLEDDKRLWFQKFNRNESQDSLPICIM